MTLLLFIIETTGQEIFGILTSSRASFEVVLRFLSNPPV